MGCRSVTVGCQSRARFHLEIYHKSVPEYLIYEYECSVASGRSFEEETENAEEDMDTRASSLPVR